MTEIPHSRSETFSDRARALAESTPAPAGEASRPLPELQLPGLPPSAPPATLGLPEGHAPVIDRPSNVDPGQADRWQRAYVRAHARLREAAHELLLEELSVDLGVGEIELSILEDRELTSAQRAALRADRRLALAQTRIEIEPGLLPSLELEGVRWTPGTAFTVTIEHPIEILRVNPDGDPVPMRWRDLRDLIERRLTDSFREGLPTLDASTLGGEPWPVGGRLELRGSLVQRLDGELAELAGSAERRDTLLLSAERVADDRVDVTLGREDDERLRPRFDLEALRLSGDVHLRELRSRSYRLDPDDRRHQAALREVLQFRPILGIDALPALSTDALDAAAAGYVRYDFSRALTPSAQVRIPTSHVTVGAGTRRYDRVDGWVHYPRAVATTARSVDRRIDALLRGTHDALLEAPPGTRMVTNHRTRFDWHALLRIHGTESILSGYLSLGPRGDGRRDERTDGFLQRDARWVRGTDGNPRVVLAYRAYDREEIRNRLSASAGLRLGPELRRAIREFGDDTLSLEENAAALLDGFWSGGEAWADEMFDEHSGDAYRALERELNDLLDQLSMELTSDHRSRLFHQSRLRTEPLDLRDPSDRAFFALAMSDHPTEEVITEGARLDLFTEQRFDDSVRQRIDRSFQALMLRLSLENENWRQEQHLRFRDTQGNTIVATGWDVGESFERDGLFEDLDFSARAVALYDVTHERTRNSGLVARFRLDDWAVFDDEATAIRAVVSLLDLPADREIHGETRGPLGLDVLLGPMFGSASGEAAVQVNQRGLREVIVKGPRTANTFRRVVLEMRDEPSPAYLRPSRGPLPAAFDPSTLLLAASGDVETFATHFSQLDLHYIRTLLRHSAAIPTEHDARAVIETLQATHPALDPNDLDTISAILEDLQATRLGRIIIEYWHHRGSSEYARQVRRDLEIEFRAIGGGELDVLQELEGRAHALFSATLEEPFVEARSQLLADTDAEPTLEQVDALMEDGFRAVAELGRPGWTSLGNQDFFALALWLTIARAAGPGNTLGRVRFETSNGFELHAGSPVLDDPNLDQLLDALAAERDRP